MNTMLQENLVAIVFGERVRIKILAKGLANEYITQIINCSS